MKAQHQCCLLILGLLSGTAFAAGVTDGIITEALIIFGLMAIPVVIFRLYFTLGRSQIMRRQLWNRFLWLTSFLLSEIGFYCGFAYLIVLSTHWEMAFELIASFFALIAIIFSLVQHHLLGPTSDGIRARLIYAASLFAYPFMLLSLIWISD